MDENQLSDIVFSVPSLRRKFGGVVAINELPTGKNESSFDVYYIFNNHPDHMPGEHWMCLKLPGRNSSDNVVEFFDSFAFSPSSYGFQLENLLITSGEKYSFLTQRLQGKESYVCGYYCLMYIYFSSIGYSLHKIFKLLQEHHASISSDEYVLRLVGKHFF